MVQSRINLDTKTEEDDASNEQDSKSGTAVPWILPFKKPNFYLPKITMSIPDIPRWYYTVFIMLTIFYVFSGSVYIMVQESVLPYLSYPDGKVDLIYTRSGSCQGNTPHQYLFEGIIAGVLMFLGGLGLYLIYEGSKEPHNPDRAFNYQVVGVILILICLLILENMMNIKGCVPPKPEPEPK